MEYSHFNGSQWLRPSFHTVVRISLKPQKENKTCVCGRTTAPEFSVTVFLKLGLRKTGISNRPTAITSGLKHFTSYHARRGEVILHAHEKSRKERKKERNKKETRATHLKVATSATGRKRPRQLTTREHIIEEKRVTFREREQE